MSAQGRAWEMDALRGVMLVAMTLTHLPTRFSSPAGQPLGFVSAAEGFVMAPSGAKSSDFGVNGKTPTLRRPPLRRVGEA